MNWKKKAGALAVSMGIAGMFGLIVGLFIASIYSTTSSVHLPVLTGFMGVLIGALINSVTSFLNLRTDMKARFQLAAVDRRLQAYQEGYAYWIRIMKSLSHPDTIDDTVSEAQTWFVNNNLYLDKESRDLFVDCTWKAHAHNDLSADEKRTNMGKIAEMGQVLEKAVGLSSLKQVPEMWK